MLKTPNQKHPFDRLVAIMAALRSKQGCPWDRKQTHRSLKPYLVEETYELLEALDSKQAEKIKGELGDFLWQALFHAQLASEKKQFNIYQVLETVGDKMVRRHPHVFGRQKMDPRQHWQQWERLKSKEKDHQQRKSALDGVPKAMPALLRARRILGKAAKLRFQWNQKQAAWRKAEEEWKELRQALQKNNKRHIQEELGDVLMAMVNVARYEGLDAEEALHAALEKLMRRFRHIEQRLENQGEKLEESSSQRLIELWNEAKHLEKKAGRRHNRWQKPATHIARASCFLN